jgi:hypothetical protein
MRGGSSSVTVIAIDPGETTGIVIVTVDTRWLRGLGEPSYDAMGRAIKSRAAYQVGRDTKAWLPGDERARRMGPDELNERMLPVYGGMEVPMEQTAMRSETRFVAVLEGEWPAKGEPIRSHDAAEVIQIRQIAGLLSNYESAAIVIEDFNLRTQVTGREVTSPDRLRLAVTANEILHGEGRTPFLQQPSYAKTTATDERLKRAGMYLPGMVHATDAARHALTFLRDARQAEHIRHHAWPHRFADKFDD